MRSASPPDEHLDVRRGYRHEWPIVALVAFVAFSFFSYVGPQDVTRLALGQSLVFDRSFEIDRWEQQTIDKAYRDGHYYSDKAPGMSVLAAPWLGAMSAAGALDSGLVRDGAWSKRRLVWILRILTGGIGYLLAVVLVGRAAESAAPGSGGVTAAVFGLGTLALPLGATLFGHVTAAALGFASFVIASSAARAKHPTLWTLGAGGCAGMAFLVEYQLALVALVVLIYVGATYSVRSALVYALGVAPWVGLLAAYNAASFGSPFRMSYDYVAGDEFAAQQQRGLFGIEWPDPGAVSRCSSHGTASSSGRRLSSSV